MKKLTVIIPFLNEGEEVENTLQSAILHSKNAKSIDYILINDASNDGYDYKAIVDKYNVQYIYNEKRVGVACCRDIGINMCQTEYFLLLDSHMRFYNENWVDLLLNYLHKYDESLLCCQTKVLKKNMNQIRELNSNSFGACINFSFTSDKLNFSVW